jgi:hypothetical protein
MAIEEVSMSNTQYTAEFKSEAIKQVNDRAIRWRKSPPGGACPSTRCTTGAQKARKVAAQPTSQAAPIKSRGAVNYRRPNRIYDSADPRPATPEPLPTPYFAIQFESVWWLPKPKRRAASDLLPPDASRARIK